MKKDLIIFGAGASYGAGASFFGLGPQPEKKSPPLGSDLFLDLCKFDRYGWGGISQELAGLFVSDFEDGMVTLAKENFNITTLQRVLAEYFFNYSIGDGNLYLKLSNLIKESEWDGSLVTLNYERLLLQSLTSAGLNPVYSKKTELDPNQIEVCLPHGCCHIFCNSIRASGNVTFSLGTSTSGDIGEITEPSEYLRRLQSDSIPPVMSYFEPNKRTLAGINFIDSQRQWFKDLVINSQNIAIVGVRVRPHDKHIWEPLLHTTAKLIYCSGMSGGKEFNQWRQQSKVRENDMVIFEYFDKAFDKIAKNMQLN